MKTIWPHAETMVRFILVIGALLAMPTARAEDPFDIDALAIDDENRFSNVGAFIVAVVDGDGNVVARRTHCSGTLIDKRVFLTAGHCTGPGKFGIPPNVKLFVSFGVNALDQSTWLAATRMTFPHPSLPPCPPPGCDPTIGNVFHAGDPGIQDTGLVFLEEPVRHIAPAKLAAPGFLETRKGAQTPMTIVGYPLPSPDAEEGDWDGLRRFRTSRLTAVLDDTWATWSLPSDVCFGDSGAPIFLNLRPGGGGAHTERLVANVSDGGIDCLSANTNARLDTEAVRTWIRQTVKEVLGESLETDN